VKQTNDDEMTMVHLNVHSFAR